MPKYRFKCCRCEDEETKYVASSVEQLPCMNCEGTLIRQMPTISGSPEVKETVDAYTGVMQNQDHSAQIKQRHDDYFWEVEVPRLVQKYSLEASLENQWLVYNEKGELVINKPPSKR